MTIKEAKENVIKNFRALNYPDHHEIEVFLLNTMEQLESVVKADFVKALKDEVWEDHELTAEFKKDFLVHPETEDKINEMCMKSHNGVLEFLIKNMNDKTCCVCGEEAELKCGHCENGYCKKHYRTTVITGNCCSGNEKDYE